MPATIWATPRSSSGLSAMATSTGTTASGGMSERFVMLTVTRGGKSFVVDGRYTFKEGDRTAVAIHLPEREDALSAVDTETEAAILDALRRRGGKHTTLIIAHRLSTLMQADEILVLESGAVAQRGTHKELRKVPGLYQRLWEIQESEPQLLTR